MNDELDSMRARWELAPREESAAQGFISFSYSSTEIFSQDGVLQMKRRQSRYADGRMVNEEWEGTLEREAYQRMMDEANQLFLMQWAAMLRLLAAPFFLRK